MSVKTMSVKTKEALLIDGPRREDWRIVTATESEDIENHLRGSFEVVWVATGLTVLINAEGRRDYPPFVRAVQAEPNPLYPDGVMILHGPVLVFGPIRGEQETSFTSKLLPLAEVVFLPMVGGES
jgi:hypothetical protein